MRLERRFAKILITSGMLVAISLTPVFSEETSSSPITRSGTTNSSYTETVTSQIGGRYSFPLRVSTEFFDLWSSKTNDLEKLIEKNSALGLWTHEYPMKYKGSYPETKGRGEEQFTRLYDNGRAVINFYWEPAKTNDLESDFREIIDFDGQLFRNLSSCFESDLTLDNFPARMARAKTQFAGSTKEISYRTRLVTHANGRLYSIYFSYTRGFSDPENTLAKIKEIKFIGED